jgi:tRNA(Ile)-lysidine synthetase-like protein
MESIWLSRPEWWFNRNGDFDDEVAATFEQPYMNAENHDKMLSPLERIILYDQIPRHLFRNQPAAHIITYFLEKALAIAIDYDSIDDDLRLCFALLPLRHSLQPANVNKALTVAWQRLTLRNGASDTIRRFIKAAYQRYPRVVTYPSPQPSSTTTYDASSVLFHNPPDDPLLPGSPSYISLSPPTSTNIERDTRPIVISLSGGVDSMVSSWLLKSGESYRKRLVAAVHVNYNNRATSDDEEAFVASWCRDHLGGIPLYVRKFDEIRRQPCMDHGFRDMYESYTRSGRYDLYRQFPDSVIVLGHNKDDRLENIFTNIAHKTKYENLDGMTEMSTVDGIRFWRPLLGHSKAAIVAFARAHNIPFLPNSTPAWSQRGQIRAQLVPVLDAWDKHFTQGLHQLSSALKDMHGFMLEEVRRVVRSGTTTTIKDDGGDGAIKTIALTLKEQTTTPSDVYWRMLFHELGITISSRSLRNLQNMLAAKPGRRTVVINKTTSLSITPLTGPPRLLQLQLLISHYSSSHF